MRQQESKLESKWESNLFRISLFAWEDLYPIVLFTGLTATRIFDEITSFQVATKKQRSIGKYMWLFYVFFFALSMICKSANGQRAFVMCSFCDPFSMYSLNIICIRTYTTRKRICLHGLPFRHLFWRHVVGGDLKWLVTNCFFVQSKSLRKGESINYNQHFVPLFTDGLCSVSRIF